MSVIDASQIVDVEGEPEVAPGHDRRRAVALAFAMFLSVGATAVGRDGPPATAPVDPPHTLVLSRDGDAVLFAFPDRLANEPPANLSYVTVVVRGTKGLAVNTGRISVRDDVKWSGPGSQPGAAQGWQVMWTEGGTAYTLSSDNGSLPDLLRVAGSLR